MEPRREERRRNREGRPIGGHGFRRPAQRLRGPAPGRNEPTANRDPFEEILRRVSAASAARPWARRSRPRNSTGRAAFGSASSARRSARSASAGLPSSIHAFPSSVHSSAKTWDGGCLRMCEEKERQRGEGRRGREDARVPQAGPVEEENRARAREERKRRDDGHPVAEPRERDEEAGARPPRSTGGEAPFGAPAARRARTRPQGRGAGRNPGAFSESPIPRRRTRSCGCRAAPRPA